MFSSLAASASKTSMKVLPIIFLFCSGSSVSFKCLKNPNKSNGSSLSDEERAALFSSDNDKPNTATSSTETVSTSSNTESSSAPINPTPTPNPVVTTNDQAARILWAKLTQCVSVDVAEQIITNGEVARGYLGVRMSEVDSDLADALGMKKPYGALINDVEEGESADIAGLIPGDVIIEFDKKEIKFSSDLPHVVGQIKPNTKAFAKIIRDGEEITLEFTLGELPVNKESFIPAKTQSSSDPIGLKVADIDRDNPSMANMPDGVIVSRVNPNSPASGKVNRGDVITMIQYKGKKYEVIDVNSFNDALDNFSSGNKIAIHLIRSGNRLIRSITLN